MKLIYWEGNNFGDKLNLWLWNKLLPGIFNRDNNDYFFGIGTLLNEERLKALESPKNIIIFGSGVGYGKVPEVNKNWKIYCLRGPLSAKKLKISKNFAVTDSAALFKEVYKSKNKKKYTFSYMPHRTQAMRYRTQMESICDDIGFQYIDSLYSVEKILSQIDQTEILLTEALHGAVIADTFRIPWIPIHTNEEIYPFKWKDWCLSMKIGYSPKYIIGLEKLRWQANPLYAQRKQFIKHFIQFNINSFKWILNKEESIKKQLLFIAKKTNPILSKEKIFENRINELKNRFELFKEDIKSKYFD